MTMSLVRGMTTLNTKKRKKKKLTDNQIAKLQQDWRAFNKKMRKAHCHSAQFEQFEQYLSYIMGEAQPRRPQQDFKPYRPEPVFTRKTPDIPSLDSKVCGFAPKKEPTKYTGTYITGIATMHKSNIIPITDKKQAIEVSQMRRN